MEKIFKLISKPWAAIAHTNGSRRMKRFLKKNDKDPVEEKHPISKRYTYTVKKFTKYLNRNGIKVVHTGRDFLPKGAFILAPNNTNDLDWHAIISAMGSERKTTVLLPVSAKKGKSSSYLKGINGFFTNSQDSNDQVTNAATSWSKSFNTAIIMFPEESPSNEITEFSVTPFEMAKKFFLPVVPVTITGSDKAAKKSGKIKIKFHSAIKPMQITTQKPDRVAKLVQKQVSKDL